MQTIQVNKCSGEELMEYQVRERRRRSITKYSGDKDGYLLESNDEIFVLHHLYLLYHEGIVCGFAITPTYADHVLARIYVEPEYQRLGVGRFTVDFLEIETLNCFTNNGKAMKFYKAMGFTYAPAATISLVTFKRKYRHARQDPNPPV